MDLQVFHYVNEPIRIVDQDGEPWFVAKDVCDLLGMTTWNSLRYLDDDEKSYLSREQVGMNPGRDISLVNEPGLYSLIFKSRKPEAKAFKRWVTHEVLPTIRKTGQDGEPWFVAKDVAETLGYARPENTVSRHYKASKKVDMGYSPKRGGTPNITVIPERDVYRLIMRSKLPEAEQFEEWVVGDVLPTIRKHGGYIKGQEDMDDDLLLERALQVAISRITERDEKIQELTPKAEWYGGFGSKRVAKTLDTTAQRLGDVLRKTGFLFNLRDSKGRKQIIPES